MSVLLALLTVVLVLTCLFMVLVILMQRAKSDGGVGAALGGGMAESAFGGETGNVLSRATTYAAITFFVLAFGLYLGRIHQHRVAENEVPEGLPTMPELMPETPATPETLPSTGVEPSTITPPEGGALVPPPVEGSESPAPDTAAPPVTEGTPGPSNPDAAAETP
jgi:preprotein translocase subunit SecG